MENSNTRPQKVKYTLIGIGFFILFFSTIALLKFYQDYLPWKYYPIIVQVENGQPIQENNSVLCNGVKIGYVDNIQKHDDISILGLNIKRKYNIPKNGLILSIEQDDTNQEYFIKMELGKIEAPYLESGDILDFITNN